MMALTPDQEKLKEAALALMAAHKNHAYFDAEIAFEALATPAAILAILAQLEQVQGDAEVSYELIQDDMSVAGASGPGALREIRHYAAVYSQDGPVEIVEVTRRKLPPPPEAA